jgi:uncharacterized protein (DUF1501 family)
MAISRRYFLKSGGIAMLGMASLPSFLQRAVASTVSPNKKKMVVLFQRGAMDGLNVVVPFAEPNYYQMRPTIAIPQPQQGGAEASSPCCRCSRRTSLLSCRRSVLPTPRAPISTRRILWSLARPE